MSDSITHLTKVIAGDWGKDFTLVHYRLHFPVMTTSVPGVKILNEESQDITEIINFTTFSELKWKKRENEHYVEVDPWDYPPWPETHLGEE